MEHILRNDDGHELEEPELADMSWSPFGKRLLTRYGKKITSLECFHTGTTTSVKRSTIRTTMKGNNFALVMEADSGEYFVAISKAQGCDEIKVGDPICICWARRYDGQQFGDRFLLWIGLPFLACV